MKTKAKKKTSLVDAFAKITPEKSQRADTPAGGSSGGARAGKKAIAGFFDPAVSRQLKEIGLEREASVQALLGEALNDLFEKHGRAPIAASLELSRLQRFVKTPSKN